MKLKDYKKHIEGLAKMNNPPVSQCIALLRQLYGKLVDIEKEKTKETELEKAAKKCARTGNRKDLQKYLILRRIYR